MRFELSRLIAPARLVWSLYRDPLAPRSFRVGAWLIVLYILMPIDLISDFIPLLGQLDDVLVLLFGLNFILKLCPPALVEAHRRRLGLR